MKNKKFEMVDVLAQTVHGVQEIEVEVPFEAICTVPKKPYGGTITVRYTPDTHENAEGDEMVRLMEWNSFGKWLESIRGEMFLAEEIASMVLHEIEHTIYPWKLEVTVSVESAFHLPVKVVASI